MSTWSFPRPDPLPSSSEVATNGLPLLQKVVQHAQDGRSFVTEDDHNTTDSSSSSSTKSLTYSDVIAKATCISLFIQKHDAMSSPFPFIAHSNLPGSNYIACQWGAFAAKKASVPLSISQKTPELEHVLGDCNPALIFVSDQAPNYTNVLQAATNLGMIDRVVHVDQLLDEETDKDAPSTELLVSAAKNPNVMQPALLLYTSGTTGKPKGVLHTHYSLFHQITDLVAAWEWQPEDVALHVLPLHHVHGVVNVLSCAAYTGAQVHFQPFDAYQLWNQWADQPALHVPPKKQESSSSPALTTKSPVPRPTVFMAVPTIYAKLLEAAKNSPPDLLQRAIERTVYPMRLMVSGSAALPTPIWREWQSVTQQTLLERYGMTEFAMALSNPCNEIVAPRQPGHVGVPLPSVQVRLVDEDDPSRILLHGTDETLPYPVSGALQVKGPTVFSEYWNRPEATLAAFTKDGYFDTGDVAEYDPALDSYRILGRASVDILKVGGNKISALEIERTLLEHPQVAEVAIVGVDDETWGQRVGMISRAPPSAASEDESPPATLQEIQAWCEPFMAKSKIPTLLLWVDEIPKNAMGKVNKKELVHSFFGNDCRDNVEE